MTITLAREEFVLLTTFRRDGTPVPTPVWIVPLDDGELGVITAEKTGKVRRIRRDGAVTLTPCTRRGVPLDPDAPAVRGTARVLDAAGSTRVNAAVRRKYRLPGLLITAMVAVRRQQRVGIAITPD